MIKNKNFLDNYLGIIILIIVSINWTCSFFLLLGKGIEMFLQLLLPGFFIVLIGLSILITARTGMMNLSAAPIGFLSASVLFVLDFSLIAWIIALLIPILLGTLFTFMQIKWKLPVMLFSLLVYIISIRTMMLITAKDSIVIKADSLLRLIGREYIIGFPITFIISIFICIVCIVFLFFCPTIQEQRKGKKLSIVWIWTSQTACLLLGLLYVLLLSSRIGAFSNGLYFSKNPNLFTVLLFCFCSQKLDNKIAPVLMIILGTFITLSLNFTLVALHITEYYKMILMLLLTSGSVFMNRVYRIKGWYPMIALVLLANSPIISTISVWTYWIGTIAILLYQRYKNWGWGEWQPLHKTSSLPSMETEDGRSING